MTEGISDSTIHNPVVLIHGLTGSRLVTKSRLGLKALLWINLAKMIDSADKETGEEDETVDLQSVPEAVGDVPQFNIDSSIARNPDPWWKDQMQLKEDGITPKVETGEIFNQAEKGLKAISQVLPDIFPNTRKYTYFLNLINQLKKRGYTEKTSDQDGNLLSAAYDWRTSPKGLIERYDYFQTLKTEIEELYDTNDQKPVVIIAHSMGNRVTHYLLQWVKNNQLNDGKLWGQEWIDTYIERYIAVAPPWLGAPMAVRLTASNDPVQLAGVVISGMRAILQSFSFIPWLLPLPEADRNEYFNTPYYSFLHEGNDIKPLDVKTTLTEAKAEATTLTYLQQYIDDPLFSGEQKDYGSKGLECPPVKKLDVIYATGTPTEVGAHYGYNATSGELAIQKDLTNTTTEPFIVKEGIIYEMNGLTQQKIDGTINSGDGVVPYASLVYFKKWQENPPAGTTITGHHLEYDNADEVVGHERIVKDRKGMNKILSLLGLDVIPLWELIP